MLIFLFNYYCLNADQPWTAHFEKTAFAAVRVTWVGKEQIPGFSFVRLSKAIKALTLSYSQQGDISEGAGIKLINK